MLRTRRSARRGRRNFNTFTLSGISSRANPPVGASVYRGPVITQREKLEESIHTEVLVEYASLTTTGAGLYNGVVTDNPASCAAWSNLAAVYDTYRILCFEVEYVPNYSSLPSTILGGIMGFLVDHDSVGAITTYNTAALYESFKTNPVDRRLKIRYDMSGSGEDVFINTASPVATGSIKTIFVGGSVATTYGAFFIRYRVQFKGRGV